MKSRFGYVFVDVYDHVYTLCHLVEMFKQDLQCQEVNIHFVAGRYIVGSYIVPLVVLPFRQFSS